MFDLKRRVDTAEMMDDPACRGEELLRAYRELATINRYLGGVRAVRRFLPPVTEPLLLDVASGGCDVGDRLAESGPWRVVGLDLNSTGLSMASATIPVVGDAFILPFGDNAFDCVTASLLFHHLSDTDCVRVLREMHRVARLRLIVNDLHRARIAYGSIFALTRLFRGGRMVQNDGPLSVRRAFRPGELLEIARRAGLEGRVHRSFPYRLVLIVDKEHANRNKRKAKQMLKQGSPKC